MIRLSIYLWALIWAAQAGASSRINADFDVFEPPPSERTLYVSATGRDTYDGLSLAKPFRTLQRAADATRPGDTVLVLNGSYSYPGSGSTVLTIETSGEPYKWIRYMAYPGHHPEILVRNHWSGILVDGAAYVLIQGFTITGNVQSIALEDAYRQRNNLNNPKMSSNGISIFNGYSDPNKFPHHVIVRDNHVRYCPGGGIATKHADYIRIEDNRVHHNSFHTPYATSGISMYLNSNVDNRQAFKMFVRGNTCFGNQNLIPHHYSNPDHSELRTITDGNGIIVDDTRNVQSNIPKEPYTGRTLIQDNIVWGNGGRGVLVYLSDNVHIDSNYLHDNARTATMTAELEVNYSSRVRAYANLISPRHNRVAVAAFGNAVTFLQRE